MQAGLTVAVVGATGRQGSAVTRHLLADGWHVRALTRRPQSKAAQELAVLGAEMIQAELSDPSSLVSAFGGAHGVYSVQNPMISGLDAEVVHGKNVADAAAKVGVHHLVYGSAGVGVAGTGVGSWESKLAVESHMKALGLPVTVLRPMAFMELMTDETFFPAASTWHLMPKLMGAERPVPWLCLDDLGAIAARAFKNPDRFIGQDIKLASDVQSLRECKEIWREVLGRPPRHFPMPESVFKRFVGTDLITMWRWLRSGHFEIDLAQTHAILPTALTVRQWLTGHDTTPTDLLFGKAPPARAASTFGGRVSSERGLVLLPVGFEQFHRRRFVNYQLNRAYSLGCADRDELQQAAKRIKSRRDCVQVFEELSQQAAAEGRLRHSTSYLRLAEFFTPPRSAEKVERYRRYRSLFDTAFAGGGLVRHDIPYADAALPAYFLPARRPPRRGTVLLHGGFDSLIEEFFAIWQRIADAGFDVVAFEGPGQGGARTLGGLTFDHDWEKPVGAVLDHFGLQAAGLVGISMGGYWAIRAAGREPRIDRVVAWPAVYDWLHRLPAFVRPPVRAMLRRRRLMRWSVRIRARLAPTLRAVVDQTLYLLDSDDPMNVVDWFLGMNAPHLGSQLVNQDVLLLCGEHDAFQPPALTRAQAAALIAARSVTVRMFTRAEHAEQHCQIGNLDLACRVLTTWLQQPGAAATTPEPSRPICRVKRRPTHTSWLLPPHRLLAGEPGSLVGASNRVP